MRDVIKENLSESSRNKKRQNISQITNTLDPNSKTPKGIKTIAIFTGENPNSTPGTNQVNRNNNKRLIQFLKDGHYLVVPSKGKFGNIEHSFAVVNIALETVKYLCGRCEQTSFCYTRVESTGLVNEYWEKKDTDQSYDKFTNPYVLKDTTEDVQLMKGANDYYTLVGKHFQFTFPFSIFAEGIERNLKNILEYAQKNGWETPKESLIEHSMKTGYSPYLYRKALYKGLIK